MSVKISLYKNNNATFCKINLKVKFKRISDDFILTFNHNSLHKFDMLRPTLKRMVNFRTYVLIITFLYRFHVLSNLE